MRKLVVVAALCGGALACGKRGAKPIERAEDAGAGVVIVHRTADGVRLVDEAEPNDEISEAMELALPAGVNGTIAGSQDVDRYLVSVDEPGALYVELPGLEGIDVVVELTDAKGEVLAHCDNGPEQVAEGFPNYPVEPGSYWVLVREYTKKRKKPREGESPPYTLTVKRAPEPLDTQELEPNSSPDAARPLVVGGEVRGFVGWRDDVDYWSLDVAGLGEGDALDIDVDSVGGVELEIGLLRGSGALLRRKGARGQALAVRGLAAPDGGDDGDAEPLLMTVGGRFSSFEEPYVIRVMRRTVGFDEETEPNDAPAGAATLAVSPGASNGVRRGNLTPGDVDYYAVPTARGQQALEVVAEPGAPSLDLALALVGADGAPMAEADAGNKGAAERLAGAGVVAGAATYLRVARKDGKDASDDDTVAPYTLRWSLSGGDVIPRSMFE